MFPLEFHGEVKVKLSVRKLDSWGLLYGEGCMILTSTVFRHMCYSALYAIARGPSVCPSHGWISQRRLKLGSRNLHHVVAP